MKREGRQHGLVQTYPIIPSPWNPKSCDSRRINKLNTPPTAGLFTKVSQKPTNHSKFTGKCGRPRCSSCHIHPAGKAKEKTKGTKKVRSCDVVTNYRLVTWRVMDAKPGLKISGCSATGILDHLANDYADFEDSIENDYDDDKYEEYDYESESAIEPKRVEIEELDGDYTAENEKEEDEMSFCEVGIVLKYVEEGDEGWCLVEDLEN